MVACPIPSCKNPPPFTAAIQTPLAWFLMTVGTREAKEDFGDKQKKEESSGKELDRCVLAREGAGKSHSPISDQLGLLGSLPLTKVAVLPVTSQ